MYRVLSVTVLLLCVARPSVAGPNDVGFIPGKSYDENGIRWSDRLSRTEPGYATYCKNQQAAKGCLIDAIRIRNETDRPIKCVVDVDYPQPNKGNVEDVHGIEIIAANSERSAIQSLAVPKKVLPASFGSRCEGMSDLPPSVTPDTCKAKFLGQISMDMFYPPASVKRNEQGLVVIEFTLASETSSGSDVVVLRSSEHPDLDYAASRIVTSLKLQTNCPGQRFRKEIPFRLAD